MPLGMEVNLSPGNVVLDGIIVPPLKGVQTPSLRFMSVVAKQLDG